jgi:hypothetical protein
VAARPLQEDRREVRRADTLLGLEVCQPVAFEDQLVGVEGVDPAGPPGRLHVEQTKQARAAGQQAFAHFRYDIEAPDHLLDPAELGARSLHGCHQAVRCQALVRGIVEKEADEPVEVEIVRGHAGDDMGRSGRLLAVGPGVADRTIEPDHLDAAVIAPGDSDRQVAFLSVGRRLVEEPERGIVEPILEGLGEQVRQGLPDPVGQSALGFGTDRPVLELLDHVGELRRGVAAQAHGLDHADQRRDEADDEDQQHDEVGRQQEPSPARQRKFDRGHRPVRRHVRSPSAPGSEGSGACGRST